MRIIFVREMNKIPEQRNGELAFLEQALDSNREQYRELSELWRSLDTKAQGTIALAGILMAAFAGFITKSTRPLSCSDQLLSIGAILLFTGGIGASALSLRLRQSLGPPHFGAIQSAIEDLLQLNEQEREDRMPDMVRENLSVWNETNQEFSDLIKSKSNWLNAGQWLTVFSIVWLAAFTLIKIVE